MRALSLSLLALAMLLSAFGCGRKDDDVAATGSRVAVQSADARSGIAAGNPGGTAAPGEGAIAPESAGHAVGTRPAGEEQPAEDPGADSVPTPEPSSPSTGAPTSPMPKGDPGEAAKQMIAGMKVEGDEKSGRITVQSPAGPVAMIYKNTEDPKITASSMGLAVPANSKRTNGVRIETKVSAPMPGAGGAAAGTTSPAQPQSVTTKVELAVYQCPTGIEETKQFLKSRFGSDLMDASEGIPAIEQMGPEAFNMMLPGAGHFLADVKLKGVYVLMKDGRFRQVMLGQSRRSGATKVVLVYLADIPQAMIGLVGDMCGAGMKGSPGKAPSR